MKFVSGRITPERSWLRGMAGAAMAGPAEAPKLAGKLGLETGIGHLLTRFNPP